MSKVRTTISIEDDVLRALRVRAAREGRPDGELIEFALRRTLGLEVLERLWASNDDLSPEAAAALAAEAIRETRQTANNA